MRYGEMTAFEERPHSPYYGSVDATPLFVILLDEYERWTGDRGAGRGRSSARRALRSTGSTSTATSMGNGYVSYKRRNEQTGLENQCWKDSWNSISFADGRLPSLPRATCELQGYAYDAKLRAARLARLVWKDDGLGAAAGDAGGGPQAPVQPRLLAPGSRLLRARPRRDGARWTRSRRTTATCCGAASSTRTRRSRSSTTSWARACSRAGASGRSPRARAGTTRSAITSERSGRFDNSFIAWGLRRYGFKEEAARIAAGILDAAEVFEGRLPEAFGGYDRELTRYPVRYPTACSPQAWSTGAPLLLLRTMLGLEPIGDHLVVDPSLPTGIGHIELLDIPGRWGRLDAFGRGRVHVHADHRPPEVRAASKPKGPHDHAPEAGSQEKTR